jgi:hypothetical protein
MKKNTIDAKVENISSQKKDPEEKKFNSGVVRKNLHSLKSIHWSGDSFHIKEEAPLRSYQAYYLPENELPGVYFKGIQYYDLKNIYFINNTGMVNLIELLKSLMEQNVEVRFVNVADKIKEKIKNMGLDHILICN